MKNFLRKIISKTSIGAPDLPTQKRFERIGPSYAPLSEGTILLLYLKPDSFEIEAILETRDDELLVGSAHDYALARFIMRKGAIEARVISYNRMEIVVTPNYNTENSRAINDENDGFV